MKQRVAAYARVSTNSKSQEHSFEFQSAYWNDTLANDPNYEYVGLFADKGISGKLIDRRPQFMAMMEACNQGKIDLIFCKSVQRFARNTEELLSTVRELREKGIGVIFEKENINTITTESELYLTIAAAVAEDDLTRYSQNVDWVIQDKFRKGENIMGYILYGYHVYNNSKLEVNPEEAKVVKEIFEMYITNQYSANQIARVLNKKNMPSPKGGKWMNSQILFMLKNEKYIGDLILQKTYTENGSKHKNNGKKQMYYVEDHHEAIIDKETWNKAQQIYEERSNKKLKGRKSVIYPFTSMIKCGVCGCHYIHKVNNSGTPCATDYWNCSNSIKNGIKACNTTGIKDAVLKEKFVEAYNEFVTNKYQGEEESNIQLELNKLYGEEKELMQLHVNGWISNNDYKTNQNNIKNQINDYETKLNELRAFHVTSKDYRPIQSFDENKLHRFVKKVTISKWIVAFEFYNGVVIKKNYTNRKSGTIHNMSRKQEV